MAYGDKGRIVRDLQAILSGGYCTRWHANADLVHIRETLAEHHARVAQIILALHPAPSLALIDAALHHDAGEPFVGDVPWPVKRDNPALAKALGDAEDEALRRIGCYVELAPEDAAWLKLADRLAAIMHVKHVAPHLLERVDWHDDCLAALRLADALGVATRVDRLMLGNP